MDGVIEDRQRHVVEIRSIKGGRITYWEWDCTCGAGDEGPSRQNVLGSAREHIDATS